MLRKEAEAKKVFTFVKPMAGESSRLGCTSRECLTLGGGGEGDLHIGQADVPFPLRSH